MSIYCQLCLTCADKAEADTITKILLSRKLIACAKQMPISSTFHWKGNVESNDEILLVMESREDLFDEIEGEVAKIHSYETFVLQVVPVIKLSKKAQAWLKSELK